MLFSGDLRRDYQLLHMLEQDRSEMGKDPATGRMVKMLKEGIRNYHRYKAKRNEEEVYKWKTYRDNWDSVYCRIEYEGIPTQEEINQYIEDEWQHWYNPYGDGRDCTGVMFTTRICVFPIPACNKTVVYHFQTMDV